MTARPESLSDRPGVMETVDALASLLETVHLGGSLYFRSELGAPWGMNVPASREAQFHVVRRGRCWLLPSDGSFDPQPLDAGDLVVLPHGSAHILVDDPATPPVPLADLLGCNVDVPADILLNAGKNTIIYERDDRLRAEVVKHVYGAFSTGHGPEGRAPSSACSASRSRKRWVSEAPKATSSRDAPTS